MTDDMDNHLPWDFDGYPPDIRLGDHHYGPCLAMVTHVSVRGGLTHHATQHNALVNESRVFVEHIFSNVKK